MFEKLLNRIGEVVAPVQSETQELFIAIRRRDWRRTRELLSSPNVDALGKSGSSDMAPLHVACAEDFVECVEYLLSIGAEVNARDGRAHETPLHHGARGGHSRVCKLLVERGASLVARNARHQTAYDVAKDLSLRQWLLPLQLRAEAELEGPQHQIGLAPPPTGNAIHDPTRGARNWQPPPPPLMPSSQQMAYDSSIPLQGTPVQGNTITPPGTSIQSMPPPPPSSSAHPGPGPLGPPPMETIISSPLSTSSQKSALLQPVAAPSSGPLAPDFTRKTSLIGGGPLSSVASSVISENPGQQQPSPPSSIESTPNSAPPPPAVLTQQGVSSSQYAPPLPPPPQESSVVPPQTQDIEPKHTGKYSHVSKRQDFTGRYADGFHSSSSDPILAAKYGHQNVKDYSHLPPPPVMSAPQIQSFTVEPSQISTATGARRYVSYDPTNMYAPRQMSNPLPPQQPINNFNSTTVFTPPPTALSKADRFQAERESMLQRMHANSNPQQAAPVYGMSPPPAGDEEGKFL